MYTWIDVESIANSMRSLGKWPSWLVNASAYVDGLLLRVHQGVELALVHEKMREWFGARYSSAAGILLDGIPDKPRPFPLIIEEAERDTAQARLTVQPFFRRLAILPDDPENVAWPTPFPTGGPEVVAFYSFKGGVGRTTHLLGYLQALSARAKPITALVVDADLEAPGITSLLQSESSFGEVIFSFADFLAMAHSDLSEDFGTALTVATYAIRRQLLPFVVDGRGSEHFFLPAYRTEEQALTLDIRPEHLIARADSQWIIPELLSSLANRLGANIVLVDLRAGLSELASPLLFDPRLRRILVTTPSKQSMDGSKIVLQQLAKIAPPRDRVDLRDPEVVISFVLQELAAADNITDLATSLFRCYPENEPGVDLPRLTVEQTLFAQDLLYLQSVTDAFAKLQGSSVSRVMNRLAEEIAPPSTPGQLTSSTTFDLVRKELSELAGDLEFAESGRGDRFLRIAPLRALARQYVNTTPIAVIVGSKGAGKTYTCLQMIRSQRWSEFVKLAAGDESVAVAATLSSQDALIWPLFQSKNLKESASRIVEESRTFTASQLAVHAEMSSVQVEDAILESLRHPSPDETWWRHRWFTIVAKTLGISVASENEAAGRIVDLLRKKSQRLIVVIDGLEDLFPMVDSTPAQQVALRALLQGVPNYLREIPNCPLGVLIFVRADLVRGAIPQNTGQFLRLYAPFALRWSGEEALRLAVWLTAQAGFAVPTPGDKAPELLTSEEAKECLVPVWGRKLGPDNSREARSAEWVIAALSDFRGQIQARDLVRFFRYAAADPRNDTVTDRVLAARSVRDAIVPCSEEKVDEIKQEIPPLREIFPRLLQSTNRRIPFDAATSGLSAPEIHFLEEIGVLIEDRGEYFMPEIFRLGLGFQLDRGARPRVLSLARRALVS
jgi:cellulose biosynthesis protein BcsQ